ncbi:3-hydroxyacyl-CoA dehydrogenase [Sphingobium sp. TA15]|uniref:3-hydroxyacyl-CoA dehydrogenase n=1 Tax=Sphingobium indicum (strain DSM 16413 / CCM 7287 / MTCC 6362 / UT26 / NBRC 101211 / UT26S) TaxID=452662 RepID=D4Z0U1_SPHIU|nr:SDR family NAD(P)-dependent oxidoreductase [Sphingobium indicum]BAI96223.1 3-hydroxyacyl-CoA dehydrogenase [Sphingobium indicum UT26S]BDD65521.1 3-hydroxyacyl-CoA dehydrogenase [Sphingobium sp. TA15]
MKLQDKSVLITGAGSGLGFETCKILAAAGARVAGFDRDADALAGLAERIGTPLFTHALDVTDEEAVRLAVDRACEEFGAVHAVINCAGVGDAAKTVSRGEVFPSEVWHKVISINLTGTFNMVKYGALAMMRNEPDVETGERGVIVNTSSGAAKHGQMGQAAYAASKAGVLGLTLPVARDLAGDSIRVVAISPGLFDTAMVAGLPDKVRDALVQKMILFPNRMGTGAEFGALVQHIIENSYLNATSIDLDAGARMTNR